MGGVVLASRGHKFGLNRAVRMKKLAVLPLQGETVQDSTFVATGTVSGTAIGRATGIATGTAIRNSN